jgi:hypothetical protein
LISPEHGEREGDVGRRRYRPAPRRTAGHGGVDGDVDDRRRDHPADRGRDRQGGPARVTQVAGDELALELQAGDEEEDRQQAVGGPLRHRQVEVQRGRPEGVVGDRLVGAGPRRVGPDHGDQSGADQQQATGGLGAQDLGDAGGLDEASAPEEPVLVGHDRHLRGRRHWIADQTSGTPG